MARVFILACRPLFAQGVQSLLSGQPGIEVVGMVAPAGEGVSVPEVMERVRSAAPDVIVVEARGDEQSLLVAQLLDLLPAVRVVALSLEDNRIHTYYQEMRQGRRVEDLLEAVKGPLDWYGRSPEELRLFVLIQGGYGQRILDNIRRFAPATWVVNGWRVPADLPLVVDDPLSYIPAHLPAAELVLSLGESSGVAQLLPAIVERTGARAVIAPIDNVDWLPDGLMYQVRDQLVEMGVNAVFPKPFCSLSEHTCNVRQYELNFDDPWIIEFARHFGRPIFRIECTGQRISRVEVRRDTACGCARYAARQLVGVEVEEALFKVGMLHHHYPCLATMRVDVSLGEPLIHISGEFMRRAVEVEISPLLSRAGHLVRAMETGEMSPDSQSRLGSSKRT
jgi:hypothetical protein